MTIILHCVVPENTCIHNLPMKSTGNSEGGWGVLDTEVSERGEVVVTFDNKITNVFLWRTQYLCLIFQISRPEIATDTSANFMRLNLCPWQRINSHLLATLATAFLKEIKRFKLINNCSCLVLLSLGNMSEIMLIKSVYFPSIDFNMGIFWNYTYIANRLSLATGFRIAASCLLLHWYFHCAGIFPLSL